MSEEKNDSLTPELGGGDMAQKGKDAGKQVANKVKDKAVDAVKKKAKEKAGKDAAKKALLKAIPPVVIFWAVVIIVAIIVIVGIIMFFATMPGLVMDKLKAIFHELGNVVAGFFGADTTEQIDNAEVFETLDYLEEMGYDLKGYGFLTGYYTNADKSKIREELDDDDIDFKVDKKIGVVRDTSSENIILAKADFVYIYMVSDNYAYTLKNDNLVTQTNTHGGFLGVLESAWNGLKSAATRVLDWTGISKLMHWALSPLESALGIELPDSTDLWGTGFLEIFEENGEHQQSGLFNWDSVKVDTEKKVLSLKRRGLFNNNNAIEYSLDGWTGRYSMPVDFLLSVHIATMMPDLAYDMATSFATNAKIVLHKASGEVVAAFKTDSGDVLTFSQMNDLINVGDGRGIVSRFLSFFDKWDTSDKEAKIAANNGFLIHSEDCDCVFEEIPVDRAEGYLSDGTKVYWDGEYFWTTRTYDSGTYNYSGTSYGRDATDDDGNPVVTGYESDKLLIEIDSDCKKSVDKVINLADDLDDGNFKFFIPYIREVVNHWYRDVYFIVGSDENINFVRTDEDYEILMGERWTLYETYGSENDPKRDSEYSKMHYGEFKLYVIDEEGNYQKSTPAVTENVEKEGDYYLYKGTKEEAKEAGLLVSKKAETVKKSDLDQYGWNKTKLFDNTIWSAYTFDQDNMFGQYEPAYGEDEIKEETDFFEKQAMERLQVKIISNSSVVQTGEGMRTETNPKIKRMFLYNTYFTYDGTPKRAEIITALRDKIKDSVLNNYSGSKKEVNGYGPLNKLIGKDVKYHDVTDLEFSASELGLPGDETYKVSDYSGQVSLSQDSLNAFSMLENTHTLDADYIYRDFKELIVELGYFTKEELTDETPRLLEFLVPTIGSGGYPNRTLDKRDDQYGTMIHSKGDIDANNAITANELYSQLAEAAEGVEDGAIIDPSDEAVIRNRNIYNKVGAIDVTNVVGAPTGGAHGTQKCTRDTGAASGIDGAAAIVTVNGVKYTNFLQYSGSYAEKIFYWGAHEAKTVHRAGCGPTSCVNILTGYGRDVNPTKDIVGISFPADMNAIKTFMEKYDVKGEVISGDYVEAMNKAFQEGKPFIGLMNDNACLGQAQFWTTGGHFVAFVGMDSEYIYTCDPAGCAEQRFKFPGGPEDLVSAMVGLWVPDEAPDGMQQDDPYVGYKGNEAVVSPVTGILLEYGTYTDDDIDSITGNPYRENVDIKYGPPFATDYESDNISDKVGYAKILVLDAESYQKLELSTNNRWNGSRGGTSLLNENGLFREELIDNPSTDANEADDMLNSDNTSIKWPDIDQTVYGYKEFAELYEKYGIAGYEILIDGFVPEIPDENFGSNDNDYKTRIPYQSRADEKRKATIYFDNEHAVTGGIDLRSVTESNFTDQEKQLKTEYQADIAYKLSTEASTNKLAAEIEVKTEASTSMYVNYKMTPEELEKKLAAGEDTSDQYEHLVFIKEGTVLGRTMTDKELLEADYLRNSEHGKYEDHREKMPEESGSSETDTEKKSLEEMDSVIGNYIRIIMRDLDTTPVEDVENYMKLDEKRRSNNDWELFFWLPFESGGTDLPGQGPECEGTCSVGETAVGIIQWTDLLKILKVNGEDYSDHRSKLSTDDDIEWDVDGSMNNIVGQFINGCMEKNPTLCAPLGAYTGWNAKDFWDDYIGEKQFQRTLSEICSQDREEFLKVQMEIAKEQYLKPILEEYPWLEKRPSCVQGTVMHLKVWGAQYADALDNENATDEEIVMKVRKVIANTGSTAGEASHDESKGRAYNEPQIALEILANRASINDVETWVRKRDASVFKFKFRY